MRTSFMTVAGLCASVLALPEEFARGEKRQANPSLSSVLSEIASLSSLLLPPASIASELTAVPPEVTAALGNPALQSSLEAEFLSSIPSWFQALPTEARSYILGVPAIYATVAPQILSLEIAAGLTTVSGAAGTGATGTGATVTSTPTGSSNSTVTTGKVSSTGSGSTTKTSSSASSSASKAASSSSSSAGAAPTNALAAGIAGAVGILGLALAL